jgi:hypothetical protein
VIVAPYEKMVPFDPNVVTKKQDKNYATGKTKKVVPICMESFIMVCISLMCEQLLFK